MSEKRQKQSEKAFIKCTRYIQLMSLAIEKAEYKKILINFDNNFAKISDFEKANELLNNFEKAKEKRRLKILNLQKKLLKQNPFTNFN